ncbi:3'-5' exonuclease [Bacillus toyonensis]
MELFKGKVVCPRCDGNGLVCKVEIKDIDKVVYVCDECDATWLHKDRFGMNNFVNYETFLRENSFSYMEANVVRFGYDWYKG